jgi:3D (Asp-Asp-Asp) domain-containing protein
MKVSLGWLFFVLLTAHFLAVAQQLIFDIAEPNTSQLERKTLWATYYHIWHATETPSGMPLLDESNQQISGRISERDWCMGAIEGTIQITKTDGSIKTYNYADHKGVSQVDCANVLGISPLEKPWITGVGKSRYRVARGTYGDGVMNYKLIPYRTVAVDKATIPYGSVLYIPKARGVAITLPSGASAVHDGFFFAADTGGAIKGSHLDVFGGLLRTNPFPAFVKSSDKHTFEAFLVNDPGIIQKLKSIHE